MGNQLQIQEDPQQSVQDTSQDQDMDTQETDEVPNVKMPSAQSGDVPDATQAVEIVTVEGATSS